MYEIRTVLGVKAVAAAKSLVDFRFHSLVKNLSSCIIFGCVAVGMFLLMRIFTGFLVHYVRVEMEPLHRLLVVALFGCFISVNFMSLILSYAMLFTSREADFLQTLPMSHRKIFILRMLDTVLASSGVVMLIGTAGALGYAAFFRLSWYHYVAIIAGIMGPLLAMAAILGVLLLMVLVLLAGKIGVRWMLVAGITLYGTLLVLSYAVTDPAEIINTAVASAHGAGPIGVQSTFYSTLWLPHGLAAAAIRYLIIGDAAGAILSITGMLSMLGVFLAVAAFVGSRAYYAAWVVSQELRSGKSGGSSRRLVGVWDLRHQWTRRPNLEAILKRDLLQIVRDPVQRIHLLMMTVLVIVTMVIGGMSILPAMKAFPGALSIITVFLFDGFLISSIALRLVFPAVSQEGKAFWCVRTAPIALSRLYWLKFSLWMPVLLIPAEGLIWTTLPMAHAPYEVMLASAVATLFVVVGLASIHLGAGAFYATQREENPAKIAASQGASATFLMSVAYLMVTAGLLVFPIARFLETTPPPHAERLLVNAVLLVGGISLVVAGIAHGIGIRSLKRDF